MIGSVAILRVDFTDLEDILKLQKKAFISEAELYNNYNIEPLKQTIQSIRDDFEKYIFLKAVYRNKIIGSVKARETGEFCWVGRLIVDPEFQNRGIGRRLMGEIEKEFPRTAQFLLCTGYRSKKNIRLYESLGYQIKEVITDEKNPGLKMVKMVKINLA